MKVSTFVSAQRFRSDAYRVRIDLDGADVGRTYEDHAEKVIVPSAKECDVFVEHE